MSVLMPSLPTHDQQERFFIGGQWIEPRSGIRTDLVCPATEEVVANVPLCGVEEADLALAAARDAFDHGPWPQLTAAERGERLGVLIDALERRVEDSATALTWETGQPIRNARSGNRLALLIGRDFVDTAGRVSLSEDRPAPGGIVRVLREPAGVALGLAPWNGPHSLMMSKLGPALVAGCTVILKPAPEAPFQAMYIAQAASEAGFPPGVVNVVTGGLEVGGHLVSSPLVDKIAFTGGGDAGRRILIAAAANFSRVTLELGGKSAAIVLDDAPIEDVLHTLVPGGVVNAGQVCRGLSRVFV
jgi:aldehyde dehydrogenase (NAD+)